MSGRIDRLFPFCWFFCIQNTQHGHIPFLKRFDQSDANSKNLRCFHHEPGKAMDCVVCLSYNTAELWILIQVLGFVLCRGIVIGADRLVSRASHCTVPVARGPVVQLARTLHSHCRGYGFDSRQVHLIYSNTSIFAHVCINHVLGSGP